MAYFETSDGVPLYYTDQGEGPTIVLLQALMFNSEYFWQKNIPDLSKKFRVIALDMRGHGLSGKPNHGYTVGQVADDVHAFLEHLNLDNIILTGIALGGLAILEYYKQFGPERLAKLCLIDFTPRLTSTPGWDHPTFGDFSEEAAAGFADAARQDQSVLRDFVKNSFALPMSDELFSEIYWRTCQTPTDAVVEFVQDMARQDYRELVTTITLPTLLFYAGSKNGILPTKVGQWMNEQIPSSELVIFENTGHILYWEDPETFNSELARFAADS